MPLFQLPQLITQLVNAQVAMTRLQQFLAAEEKPAEELLEPVQKGAPVIQLNVLLHPSILHCTASCLAGEYVKCGQSAGTQKHLHAPLKVMVIYEFVNFLQAVLDHDANRRLLQPYWPRACTTGRWRSMPALHA